MMQGVLLSFLYYTVNIFLPQAGYINLESEIKPTLEAPMLEPVSEHQLLLYGLCAPTFFCSLKGFLAGTSLLPCMIALKAFPKFTPLTPLCLFSALYFTIAAFRVFI